MKLSEWIKNYAEENNITLPDDIPDEKTALKFLDLNTESGGGGDGDFSTAEVTFGDVPVADPLYFPCCFEEVVGVVPSCTLALSPAVGDIVNVVLYKGTCIVNCEEPTQMTGDVRYDSSTHLLLITGNCSVAWEDE